MMEQGEADREQALREEVEGFRARLRLLSRLPTFLRVIFSPQEHSHGKAGAGGKAGLARALGLAGAQQPPRHQQQLAGQMALPMSPLNHSKTQPLSDLLPAHLRITAL